MSEPVSALGLSHRAANPLRHAGIETIEQLTARTFTELWRIKGLGVHTLREITEALTARGLALAFDPEEIKTQRYEERVREFNLRRQKRGRPSTEAEMAADRAELGLG